MTAHFDAGVVKVQQPLKGPTALGRSQRGHPAPSGCATHAEPHVLAQQPLFLHFSLLTRHESAGILGRFHEEKVKNQSRRRRPL